MPLIQEEKLTALDSFEIENSNLKMDLRKITEQQNKLLEQQNLILSQLTSTQKQQGKKDFWDRVAAIAPILSGTIIALGGAYFTTIYNEQQLKLQEVQTIERFIPHLLGDEKSKRAAVLAISSLGNAKLAARVAAVFASPGTVSALESIARNDHNSSDRGALKGALDRALDNMAEGYRVEKKYEDAIATYKKVLALREQTYGQKSSRVVPSLNRLAALYNVHGDHPEAEVLLRRAVEIQKSEFGRESMQHAEALRKLAALYSEQGQDANAKDLLNDASAIEQKLPSTAKGSVTAESEDSDPIPEPTEASSALQPSTPRVPRGSGEPKTQDATVRHPDRSGTAGEPQNESLQPEPHSASAAEVTGAQKSEGEHVSDTHSRIFSPRKLWETQESTANQ
ncbi:MAG: tetratricopeptide repeat protein [Candidatus Obscuribacterales bacterium]|jgi:tetratricopeptide (TPR) repeat protein|nr:tetratricopeptide repeat protein [Candidatus Obscuribacterales bacterium]